MQPKEGSVDSPTWLTVVRRMKCLACTVCKTNGRRKSEAHHWPVKGMGGATHRDDLTMPLCRAHHDDAQELRIDPWLQDRWVQETRARVWDEATPEELLLIVADLKRYKERPLAVPF